jgi:hypothetical protein
MIYDKEIIKICNQPGSDQMDYEKDEPSTERREKNGTLTTRLKRQNGIWKLN